MKIVAETLVYDDWVSLRHCRVELPNGAVESRHLEDHGNAAVVFAYDPVRRCAILLTQPRLAVFVASEEPIYEAIAGRLDGMAPETVARKEALEEAGLMLDSLEFIAQIWSLPAMSTERLSLYLATYDLNDKIKEGGGAEYENECIEVHEIPLSKIAILAMTGQLTDGKTLILVQALQLRRPDLFD